MASVSESVRDNIVFEILKFLAKRIWLASLGTATITGLLGQWFSPTWEIMSLFALTSTLIVMITLIHFRDTFLPKDLFLKPSQQRILVHRLRPFADYEIQITYFARDGQQYALDIAGAFSAAGCKSVTQKAGILAINQMVRFEICGPDEVAGNAICAAFNSIGLETTYRKTIADHPQQMSVLIGRLT
jgi:hypothetical protein